MSAKKTSRESFRRSSDIASYLLAFYDDQLATGIEFIVDMFKCNRNLGYTVKSLDTAIMPAYYAIQHLLMENSSYDYDTFRLCVNDAQVNRDMVELFQMFDRESAKSSAVIGFYEKLNCIDHDRAVKYLQALNYYSRYVGQEAGIDSGVVGHWLKQLEMMSVGAGKSLAESAKEVSLDGINVAVMNFASSKMFEKKEKKGMSKFAVTFIVIDILTTIGFICAFSSGGDSLSAFILGVIWFGFWLVVILSVEYNWDLGPSSPSSYDSAPSSSAAKPKTGSGHGWLDDFDMTKDYYGKHGEFDRNDESRRVSEDMQQFHNSNRSADLSDHYYWDDVLDAESDGYLDD